MPDKGQYNSHMLDICCRNRTSYQIENTGLWERDVSPRSVIFMGIESLAQKKLCMKMGSTSFESRVGVD